MKLSSSLFGVAVLLPVALATYFNGDVVNGVQVITELDINNLQSNKVHRFYLRAAELNSGAPVHVPVVVARGPGDAQAGKTMMLTATVHGDEVNPIRVAQKVISGLDASRINGTIIIVPGVNVLGISRVTRFYPTASSGGNLVDPNRLFPGSLTGAVPSIFDYNLWQGLTKNGTQIDVAIDMHTTSTGAATPLWCYSDYAVPENKRLAELIGADIIKVDPGEPGSLETTFVEFGIPAITLEIASPRIWQPEYIQRSYDFVLRALAEWQIISKEGVPGLPDVDTFAGTTFASVSTPVGGYWMPAVAINQDVSEGDFLGRLYNSFGDVLEEYTAPVSGRVHTVNTDPANEPGRTLIQIITERQTNS